MKFRFIEDHRDTWPVRLMCDALEVSHSGYYAWRGRRESPRAAANRALLAAEPGGTNVTQVALELGFEQFGRFSGDYKKAFGELPSETLAG